MIEPEVFREAIAAHAILHAAGVDYADIFVTPNAVSPSGKQEMAVLVRRGDFQFAVTVGPCPLSNDEFMERWPDAIQQLHAMSDEEARELRDSTKIRNRAIEMIAAYQAKWSMYQRMH